MNFIKLLLLFFFWPAIVLAVQYDCQVEKKLNFEKPYSREELENGKYSVVIEESGLSAFLSRCSYALSEQAVTCDRYEVDKVVFDQNVKIKKFYVFRSQFDVQLFSNMTFLENNGRGGIAFGTCKITAP